MQQNKENKMDTQELIQKALEQGKITSNNLYDVLNIDEGDMDEIREMVKEEVADQTVTFLRDVIEECMIDKELFSDFSIFYYAMTDSDLDLQIEDMECRMGIDINPQERKVMDEILLEKIRSTYVELEKLGLTKATDFVLDLVRSMYERDDDPLGSYQTYVTILYSAKEMFEVAEDHEIDIQKYKE
jgi:hypothetical protein